MRKILALLLTLVMFMSLIACGVKQEKNTSQESTVMNEGNNEKHHTRKNLLRFLQLQC